MAGGAAGGGGALIGECYAGVIAAGYVWRKDAGASFYLHDGDAGAGGNGDAGGRQLRDKISIANFILPSDGAGRRSGDDCDQPDHSQCRPKAERMPPHSH